MNRRSCCVPGCQVTSKDGVPLHSFPNPETDSERFQQWILKVGGEIAVLDSTTIHRNRRVCHYHFLEVYHYPKNRLCQLAVPTLKLPALLQEHVPDVTATTQNMPSTSIESEIGQSFERNLFNSVIQMPELQSPIEPTPSTSAVSQIPKSIKRTVVQYRTPIKAVAIQPSTSVESPIPLSIKKSANTTKKSTKRTRTGRNCFVSHNELEFKQLTNKLRKCQKDKLSFRRKFRLAKKITKTTAFNLLSKKMSSSSKLFCHMQFSQSGKKRKGRRFTLDEKILALSLYKPSPKAYRLLSNICILPSRRTLQNLLQKINLKPGINEIIFENLKKRVSKMPENHKYCILAFDEMAISPGLSYNKKNDNIVGLVDNGEIKRTDFCDHVLVFMIRGAVKKYKQPLSFTYCSGSTKTVDLKQQIKNIISKVQGTGLKVLATVCDQGTSNVAAINQLIAEAKEAYLKEGKEFTGGFFKVAEENIFPIFDPPHLIKGIRNNLLTKNLKYTMKNKERLAKWSHIEKLYNRSPGYRGIKLVPRLTAQHVIPALIPKMRVKHCTQIFSMSVGVALGYMAESGTLPQESTDTADLLIFFDQLFDSVNGSYSEVKNGKIYRSAVTPTSPHHKLWNESLPILKTMRFIGGNNQGLVPSISSWIKTIEGVKLIFKYLHSKGISSLLLRNFNQDALENFFGAIRAHGYSNTMPTASAFEGAFKTLLINNITSSHSLGANCEKDDSICLQNLKNIIYKKDENKEIDLHNTIEIEHFNIDLINTQALLEGKSPMQIERSAAIGYCSGWIAQLAKKYIYKKCQTCSNDLETNEEMSFHKFIKMKEYSNKKWLCYPTRTLFDFFAHVEQITIEILKKHSNKSGIASYIKLIATINISLIFLTCEHHSEELKKNLVNKSTLFFLLNWCKDVNNVLTGKITFWDVNDPLKNAANTHFSKNKGRKRK